MKKIMKDVIIIDSFDELASIIDKILTHGGDTIFLAVPRDAYIAQNVLNFQLIKREAESVGRQVIIISSDKRIQSLATQASLKVKDDTENYLSKDGNSLESRKQTRNVTDIISPENIHKDSSLVTDLRNTRVARSISKSSLSEKKQATQNSEVYEKIFGAPSKEEELIEQRSNFSTSVYNSNNRKSLRKKKGKLFSFKILPTKVFLNIFKKSFEVFTLSPFRIITIFLGIVIIGAIIFVMLQVLPRATVILNPESKKEIITLNLIADSNISSVNLSKGIMPAQVLEEKLEKSFTFSSTGKIDVNEFATGKVTIYNEYSSSPQTLVASTRLVSSTGQLFRITETVIIAGATIEGGKIISNSTIVNVKAAKPGSDSNIGSTTFSIPGFKGTDKYLSFYGESKEKMTGGFTGERVVVTEKDITEAKKKVENEFLPQAAEGLQAKIPEDLIVLEDSFDASLITLDINAQPQDPKNSFTINAVAVARTFLIREEDINNAIAYQFINSLEYSKEFELSDSRNINYTVKEIDYTKGYVEFTMKVDQIFNKKLDAMAILDEIRGKDEIEVRRILSRKSELERAEVRFWPFWVKRIPNNIEDIEIKVEYLTDN